MTLLGPPGTIVAVEQGSAHPLAPLVSVVIAAGSKPGPLAECLQSLVQQASPPPFELLICAEDIGTAEEATRDRFPDAHITVLSGRTPAAMRNAVIPRARGELLMFLDDDVVANPNLLRNLGDLSVTNPEVGVFGGPNVTPAGSSHFQFVQGAVLSSLLGAGPVRRRYGPHPPSNPDERWFTLCNLAVRRRVMVAFDDRLVCAEENEVLEELSRRKIAMLYSPELVVSHRRRASWEAFAAQMLKYGRGRGQVIARRPSAARPSHFLPLALLAYLAALAFVLPVNRSGWELLPLAIYLSAIAGNGAWIALSLRRPSAALSAAGLTGVVHGAYGAGVALGLVEGTYSAAVWPAKGVSYRFRLFHLLVRRQLRLRSKRSFVGIIWPILSPILLWLLYVFVFRGVFRVHVARYPEFLFAGLLPWTFLTQTLGTAITSISGEADLVKRARFPYELIPMATVAAMSMYFLVTLTAFVVFLGVGGRLQVATLPLLLIPIASLYLFVSAVAMLLALIDVHNRDLRHVLANILTVWFFLVPIVYRQDMLGPRLRILQSMDPVNIIVGQFRDILYFGSISRPAHLVQVIVVCAGCYIVARAVFRRFSRRLPLHL